MDRLQTPEMSMFLNRFLYRSTKRLCFQEKNVCLHCVLCLPVSMGLFSLFSQIAFLCCSPHVRPCRSRWVGRKSIRFSKASAKTLLNRDCILFQRNRVLLILVDGNPMTRRKKLGFYLLFFRKSPHLFRRKPICETLTTHRHRIDEIRTRHIFRAVGSVVASTRWKAYPVFR